MLVQTAIPGPQSVALHARKTAAVAAGVGTTLPVYVDRAGGGIVVDVDGHQLIDFGSGIAVIIGRQRRAARRVERCGSRSPTSPTPASWSRRTRRTSRSCEQLNELTPGTHEKRSALFNSGAEAVENAVKIARHATGRQAVVVFDHAYHGRTNLTMALTAKNMPYKHRFGPFAGEIYRVPMSYPFRWPAAPARARTRLRRRSCRGAQAGRRGERRRGAHRADPGRGRLRRPAAGLPAPRWRRGAPTTASSSSPTRSRPASAGPATGSPASIEGVVPDLITTAKGIAGGLPLAGVTGRAEIMDAVHVGGLGGTYGGNPVACAAALAAIETMRRTTCAPRPGGSSRSCCPGCGRSPTSTR